MQKPIQHTHSFTFWPQDLHDIFVTHFAARRIIGGLKGFCWPGTSFWITHGRLLLTKLTDSMIGDLFFINDWLREQAKERFYYSMSHFSPQVGAILAGLLQKQEFLPQILTLISESEPGWYHSGGLLGLLLLDRSQTLKSLKKLEDDPQQQELARLGFAILNLDDPTDYLDDRVKRQVKRGLEEFHRMLGGIKSLDSNEIRQKLSRLLMCSTPPLQAMQGWLTTRIPRVYEVGIGSYFELTRDQRTLPNISQPERVVLSGLPRPDQTPATIGWGFTKAVQSWLRNGAYTSDLGRLTGAAMATPFPQDLFGGLEADPGCQIPPAQVQIVFERLLKMLPPSDYLFEAYAYALLMRGNQSDEQAKNLLNRAEQLRKDFDWALRIPTSRFPVFKGYELLEDDMILSEKGCLVVFNER